MILRNVFKERRETKRRAGRRKQLNNKKSGKCITMEIRPEIKKKKNDNEIRKKNDE